MAEGFTDFSEHELGAIPDGWVECRQTGIYGESGDGGPIVAEFAGAPSGKVLKVGTTEVEGRLVTFIAWEAPGTIQNGEVVGLIVWHGAMLGIGFDTPAFGVAFRGQTNTPLAGESKGHAFGEHTESKHLTILWPGDFPCLVSDEKDGTNLRITSPGYAGGTLVWLRCNFNGEALKLKHWEYETPEPETWAIEWTEAGLLQTTGFVGLGVLLNFSYGVGNDPVRLAAIGYSDDPLVSAPMVGGGGGGGFNNRGRGQEARRRSIV